MPMPATTGILRTKISDMEIGDYIKIGLHTSRVWKVNYGSVEVPLMGLPNGYTPFTDRFYYLIKVAKGLIVADRVVIHSWSWESINSGRYIQGLQTNILNEDDSLFPCTYRSLTGGVAYSDANGNKSLTDQGFGAWPTNNEWDRHIVNFPEDKIQEDKALEDVFHYKIMNTLCQDTPVINTKRPYDNYLGTNIARVVRSHQFHFLPSSSNYDNTGFRPVFEYKKHG